jgi:hypothetical protein
MKGRKRINTEQKWIKGETQELVKIKIPVGARFFAAVQTGPGAYPASSTIGTGSLSRG